ncbi:diaminobutyrate--2-oxoglutarate transaminase [Paenibacillus lutrae]|uniref:Diaminobutyrate--2-oxoglutarate transaminase n=1 Tax=Paenibacillus lutrae TaxID=2078573 RepID=A0A7X3K179_9BACL|nr:diaminobutyrate--2-oxoglutarate transaminase [Paenibacillus lutrae]MVP01958.1 diaminobutyrate--2-oxoglutarate transaminase [Paenibacillus lutrae]
MNDSTFAEYESNVRSYCRSFPAVFRKASGDLIYDEAGNPYLDFLSGASSLNYGHNNGLIRQEITAYLQEEGIVHSLDMYTAAKRSFIEDFVTHILKPRGLDYKLQFPGPAGTNAVEAAMKLARKVTGRTNIIAFTNAFHGMSLGALSATTDPVKRSAAGISLPGVTFMPYCGSLGSPDTTLEYMEKTLTNRGSGVEPPAGFLVELVQGEGGLNTATSEWLQGLASLARRLEVPLIVDDIQAGCGRTGTFFSFEEMGITPDIVCLAKSLSGYGLPMALVLLKRELDVWQPGEHNGTFRGNNLGFVGASAAIRNYWRDRRFQESLAVKSAYIRQTLQDLCTLFPEGEAVVKGRGLMLGLDVKHGLLAETISRQAFTNGLIIETCGRSDQVVKLLPPLTISDENLKAGLGILRRSMEQVLEDTLLSV